MIAAGLAGLRNGTTLPADIDGDPASWSPGPGAAAPRLPARRCRKHRLRWSAAAVLREALGEPLAEAFLAVRRAETEQFAEPRPGRDRRPDSLALVTALVGLALPLDRPSLPRRGRGRLWTAPRSGLLLTEIPDRPPPGTSCFDSPLGFAVRRWCAPVLDLEPLAPAAVYLDRRGELGSAEVSRRLLRGREGPLAGRHRLPAATLSLTPAELARAQRIAGARGGHGWSPSPSGSHERAAAPRALQRGRRGGRAAGRRRRRGRVQVHRRLPGGLGFNPARPGPAESVAAADRWCARWPPTRRPGSTTRC